MDRIVVAIGVVALCACAEATSSDKDLYSNVPAEDGDSPGAGSDPLSGGAGSGAWEGNDPSQVIPGGGGRRSIGDTPLPCELDDVLKVSCRSCHGADPGLQSPMALVTHEDLMAPAVSDPTKKVHELMQVRVHHETAPMPPEASRALTEDELGTLDGWMAGGTPAGDAACDMGLPADITGITYGAPDPDEIDECYTMASHGKAVPGDTTPFMARGGEYYSCFYFDVPWEGEKQALTFRSLDTPITHHWLLYDTTEPAADGSIVPTCSGSHPGFPELLAVYAVNQQREQHMPREAGLKMPVKGSGHKFLLEIHYFNPGGPVEDVTGVEVCTAKENRPNTATVSWLGTEAIALLPGQNLDLPGTCTPPFPEDIFIFRAFPHMHERGVRMDTVINRADGTTETLIDEPFDFNNQVMFDTPAVIHPDDYLTTTCHFVNDTDRLISVGYDSASEMCFNFVYAWPANALVNGLSLTGTSTPCLL